MPNQDTKELRLLTTHQVAELLGLKPQTLALWRTQDKGPKFVKLGKAVRYRLSDWEPFIDSHGQEGEGDEEGRLHWKLAGLFVKMGPPNSTLVWSAMDYRVSDLEKSEGRLEIVDGEGQRWHLIDNSEFMREILGFI